MTTKSGSKYQKVLLAAQRTKQLQNGATPRVKLRGAKPSRIALSEIEQGLLQTKGGERKGEAPCSVSSSPAESLAQAQPTRRGNRKNERH